MNCKLSEEMARSITESRKILERLQKQLITRVIERGSSVKKIKNNKKKSIKIMCLGTKPKSFGYMFGKEPRWMN